MKFFENKKFFQKMIIAIFIVTIFTFMFSCNVQAKSEVGGKLLKPVVSLITGFGDGLMDVVHNALLHQDGAYIRVDLSTSVWNVLGMVAAIIGGAILVGLAVYFTAGVAVPAIVTALGGEVVTGVSAGVIAVAIVSGAVVGGAVYHSNVMGDDLVLPMYSITPEEIFSGELAIFDVDFFNPDTKKELVNTSSNQELDTEECSGISEAVNKINEKYKGANVKESDIDFSDVKEGGTGRKRVWTVKEKKENDDGEKVWQSKGVYIVCVKGTSVIGQPGGIQPDRYYIGTSKNFETSDYASIAYKLRPTVAAWYKILRNLAIVGSLSILIYIAIRIIISSSAADKSKYKQRLYDWLISICLIFIMHYIMAGSNLFVNKLSGMLNSVQKPKYIPVMVLDDNADKEKIENALTENVDALVNNHIIKDVDSLGDLFTQNDGKDVFIWPTNLMGILRIETQKVKQESTVAYAGYTIMYFVLVIFTLSFTFTYLKRILYLAFLTIIAPFVAMTYALDKLKDGSAQGFNNWFKEYMVNLLIQPIHLLLYTVLVSSAIQLAESNLIYGIVAIGFMMPAEKLVRRFFGINATETQGLLAGPAGAALVMTGVNRLLGHRPPPLHNNGAQNDKDIKDKINYKDTLDTGIIYADANSAISSNSFNEKSLPVADTDTKPTGDTNTVLSETTDNNIPKTHATNDETRVPNVIEQSETNDQKDEMSNISKKSNVWDDYNANKNAYREYLKQQNKSKDKNVTNDMLARRLAYNTKKKIRRPMDGLRRGLKFYGRGLGKNMANAINRGDPARKMISFAHGVGTAALAGGIGLAAGVASGDLTKTGQYAAAATLGGHKLGSAISEWETGALDVPNAGEYFARGYYGDQEYEEKQREKIIKRMKRERMNDEFIRDFSLRTDMTEKEAKEYLEKDDFLEEGIKYGFSDANEFATAKMVKEDTGDQKKAFAHTKMIKDYGSDLNKLENDREAKDSYLRALSDRFSYNMAHDEDGKVINKKALEDSVNALYEKQLKYSKEFYKK